MVSFLASSYGLGYDSVTFLRESVVIPIVVGQAGNSHLGPFGDTEDPSGQSFAIMGQATGVCIVVLWKK